jgi:hypothetical protein
VPRRKRQDLLHPRENEIVTAYQAGTPTKDILADLHISTNTLAQVRHKHGLGRRRASRPTLTVASAPAEQFAEPDLERLNAGTGFATPQLPPSDGQAPPAPLWEISYVSTTTEGVVAPDIDTALRLLRERHGASIDIRLVRRAES